VRQRSKLPTQRRDLGLDDNQLDSRCAIGELLAATSGRVIRPRTALVLQRGGRRGLRPEVQRLDVEQLCPRRAHNQVREPKLRD
jgi:hypothetical protein